MGIYQRLLPLLVLCGILCTTDSAAASSRSACYRSYNTRRGRCRGRIDTIRGSATGVSYTKCCSDDKAAAWKPIRGSKVCIKCVDIVDGQWGAWAEWTQCSATCDYGVSERERSCDSPAPKHGGSQCKGLKKDKKQCFAGKKCPVHGGWSIWSEWSSCSMSCGMGIRLKTRSCSNPKPRFGGNDCSGVSENSENCVEKANCPVDGGWSVWLAWSYCDQSCGQGRQTRRRHCNNPQPTHNGRPCDGLAAQAEPCSIEYDCDIAQSGNGNEGSGLSGSGSGDAEEGSAQVNVIYPTDTESSASGDGDADRKTGGVVGTSGDTESGDVDGSFVTDSTDAKRVSSTAASPSGTTSRPTIVGGGEGTTGVPTDEEDDKSVVSGGGASTGGSGQNQADGSATGTDDFFIMKS